jgi:hypothetical protein
MITLLGLLSAFIFHVVPAYLTYAAAIAPTPASTRKWLAFWCVHTLFACAELALDALASHALAYGAAKAAVFAWLVFLDGASVIYDGWLGGVLRARSSDIDAALLRLQGGLRRLLPGAPAAAAAAAQAAAAAAAWAWMLRRILLDAFGGLAGSSSKGIIA